MKFDAHQHFWKVSDAADYPWMSSAQNDLHRDFQPEHLAPLLARHGVEGTLLVQASPTVAETHRLLAIARATPFVRGVVGWCDFEDPNVSQVIDALACSPLLRALRPMVQDIPDDDWLLRDELTCAFEAMVRHGLVFDALVHPRHLARLAVVAERHPALSVVVDHGAKPAIQSGQLDPWRRDIARVAERAGTFCKLSGLVTECGTDWSVPRLRLPVDHLLSCFGPQRLLWGSDWPVVNLAGGYDAWFESACIRLADLSSGEREAVFGANARRVYFGE
jgi:L-fuconolactonase